MDVDEQMVASWKYNIPKFAWDNFGLDLEDWQDDVGAATLAKPKVRVGMQAAVGVGKSLEEAVIGWHFQATNGDEIRYPKKHPIGYALSISGDNLKSGLWKELGILYERSDFLRSQFLYTAEQITHREHPGTWWLKARSYAKSANPEQQGATLSGLHGPYLCVLLDEVGEMHPAIGRKAEQILSDAECERGIILAAGNPTSVSGLLYHIASDDKNWQTIRITGDPDDPKRSRRVDINWAREQIEKYGRDNPWVMAHILGQFPPGGLNALLGPDEVREAMERAPREDTFHWAQRRFGVDVARFGDDRTVIFPRQGVCAFRPTEYRQQDTNFIGASVLRAGMRWDVEMVCIDDTGHWGHGVVDNLNATGGLSVIPVNFADTKTFNPRYFNRRTEMWFEMAEWITAGGALPKVDGLLEELVAATFYYQGGKIRLVEKDVIKETLGRSPDLADALALTFALPDMPGGERLPDVVRHTPMGKAMSQRRGFAQSSRIVTERDPFVELDS